MITVVDVYTGTTNDFSVNVVDGLTFRTNYAREFGPFGLTTGTKSTSYGERLNGIFGEAGVVLTQINLVWEWSLGCGKISIFYLRLFYPHPEAERFVACFKVTENNIEVFKCISKKACTFKHICF